MHKDRQAAGVKLCDAEVEEERRRTADLPSEQSSTTSMNKGLNKREVLVCSDDPLNDGVSDLVVDHPVVGTADEELVLIERRGKKDINQERDFYLESILIGLRIFGLAAGVPLCRCSACSSR